MFRRAKETKTTTVDEKGPTEGQLALQKLFWRQAEELAEKLKANAPKHLEQYKQQLEWDKEHFQFECERFGDFLMLRIQMDYQEYDGRQETHKDAEAINLNLVSSISFRPGRPPSMDGKDSIAGFIETTHFHSDGGSTHTTRHATMRSRLEANEELKVMLRLSDFAYPKTPLWSGVVLNRRAIDTRFSQAHCYSNAPTDLRHNVEGLAITYECDVIELDNFYLNIPFGLGESVHKKILEAIKGGCDKPTSPR